MKSVLTLAAAALAVSATALSARADLPGTQAGQTAGAVVGAQYGYAAFEQSIAKAGGIESQIHINGLAAYAIYTGMKDVQEVAGQIPNTKVKNGENISCTLALFNQVTCTLAFEALPSGKFSSGH